MKTAEARTLEKINATQTKIDDNSYRFGSFQTKYEVMLERVRLMEQKVEKIDKNLATKDMHYELLERINQFA